MLSNGNMRMGDDLSMVELARRLGEVASQTRDPESARRLMALVNEVLAAAGLPAQSGDSPAVTESHNGG